MYAGASGDFNPMHTRRGRGAGRRACRACSGTACSPPGLLGKALTDYVGVGNLRLYKIRFTKQTWPGETLTTHVTVAKKYDESTGAPRRPRVLGRERGRRGQAHRGRHRRAPARRAERVDSWPRCGSTSRTPTSRRSPSGTRPSEGKLLIKHCNACGEYHFYPRPFCPKCWSDDVEWDRGQRPGHALHVVGRAPQRPAAVPGAGALRRGRRRPRRGAAHDDERRRLRVRRPRDRHGARGGVPSRRADDVTIVRVPAGG